MAVKKAAAEPAQEAQEKKAKKPAATKKADSAKTVAEKEPNSAAKAVKEPKTKAKPASEEPKTAPAKPVADKPKAAPAADEPKAAAKKPAAKKAPAPKPKKETPAAPAVTCIFKAIETADIASFTALVAMQKNRRGKFGRTPLMVVNLIRSNPRMTDGSNFETKRATKGKEIYDKMYRLLLDAKCDTNAMDDAGNTARDYNYGGILNQMLAD